MPGLFPVAVAERLAVLVRTGPKCSGHEPDVTIPPGKYGEIGFGAEISDMAAMPQHWSAGHCGRLKTKQALVPPNPNEFDRTNSTSRLRALCGTRSIAVATDELSRLSVGGTI
jgi:hypothetical protein